MKKGLLIVLIILIVIGGIGGGIYLAIKKKAKTEENKLPEVTGVLIETPLEDRPYVTLTPRTDGREFTIEISRIKNAQKIEYELVYLSNDLSRGVIGSVDVKGKEKISRNLLLGTCSKNVCRYDENVTEGTLTVRFRSSEGVRKFTSDFHLQRGDEILSSLDEQFSLRGRFSRNTYYLTMETIGLPGEIEDEVSAGPYGVFTNGQATPSAVSLGTNTSIYFWDGQEWQASGKGNITSTVAFIAIASQE